VCVLQFFVSVLCYANVVAERLVDYYPSRGKKCPSSRKPAVDNQSPPKLPHELLSRSRWATINPRHRGQVPSAHRSMSSSTARNWAICIAQRSSQGMGVLGNGVSETTMIEITVRRFDIEFELVKYSWLMGGGLHFTLMKWIS